MDIIKKSGSWYSYGTVKLGQGKDNAKITIEENPELLEELTEKVMAKLKEGPAPKDKKKKKSVADADEDEDGE